MKERSSSRVASWLAQENAKGCRPSVVSAFLRVRLATCRSAFTWRRLRPQAMQPQPRPCTQKTMASFTQLRLATCDRMLQLIRTQLLDRFDRCRVPTGPTAFFTYRQRAHRCCLASSSVSDFSAADSFRFQKVALQGSRQPESRRCLHSAPLPQAEKPFCQAGLSELFDSKLRRSLIPVKCQRFRTSLTLHDRSE